MSKTSKLRAIPPLPADQKLSKIRTITPPPNAPSKLCDLNYELKDYIAQGSYGTLYGVCREGECKKWVLKRIRQNKASKKEVEKEVYIMRRLNGTGLAPRLLSAWYCMPNYNLVMERFDRSMFHQGHLQFKQSAYLQSIRSAAIKSYEALEDVIWLAFSESQLRQMVTNAVRLGAEYKMVHGDGNLANMLYRTRDDKVVYSDFGFSGDYVRYEPKVGYGYRFGCKAHEKIPLYLRDIYNLADLQWSLFCDAIVFIDEKLLDNPHIILPHKKGYTELIKFCPEKQPVWEMDRCDEFYSYRGWMLRHIKSIERYQPTWMNPTPYPAPPSPSPPQIPSSTPAPSPPVKTHSPFQPPPPPPQSQPTTCAKRSKLRVVKKPRIPAPEGYNRMYYMTRNGTKKYCLVKKA